MNFGSGHELQHLETAMEAAGMAWWWIELPSGAVFFSPNKAKMLDRDPEDFLHYEHFTKLVHPDDYEQMMQDMRNHLTGAKDLYQTAYRIKTRDGSYKQFLDKGKIVSRKPNGDMSLAGIVIDISSFRKELIEALPAVEKRTATK